MLQPPLIDTMNPYGLNPQTPSPNYESHTLYLQPQIPNPNPKLQKILQPNARALHCITRFWDARVYVGLGTQRKYRVLKTRRSTSDLAKSRARQPL